ncbi:hypothetical protein F4054_12690 [Candidatus Poribacteria bacterium]|nr:hypothetical protein [Candidatus Poribacteria bacterium]MYG07682.1 hypothetical protein [Candidatus Poribacteria bacterium]MYK23099.1 hypothetical protein [Candidatus Poribacteria bacterium]
MWVAILTWFVLWVGFSRSGARYDFFIGLSLSFATAWLLWVLPRHLIQKLKSAKILYPDVKENLATAIVAFSVLIPVVFWQPLGGHAIDSVGAAKSMICEIHDINWTRQSQ